MAGRRLNFFSTNIPDIPNFSGWVRIPAAQPIPAVHLQPQVPRPHGAGSGHLVPNELVRGLEARGVPRCSLHPRRQVHAGQVTSKHF